MGSWIAARIAPRGDQTEVVLMGKPTVNGTEVCSDDDVSLKDVSYWCQDTTLRDDYPRKDLLDGRAEAEAVVGILEELKIVFPQG